MLELDLRPDNPASAAIYDFAKGYAMLKSGDPAVAQTTLTSLRNYVATTDDKIRFHPAKHVVGVLVHILAGEIQLTDGEVEAAIDSFKQAVALEDSLDYDEPEPLPFAARHWLGQTLLRAGHPTKARIFRAELEDHPQWLVTFWFTAGVGGTKSKRCLGR